MHGRGLITLNRLTQSVRRARLPHLGGISLLIVPILAAVILSTAANMDLPYEQDEASKAAKIVYMATTNSIFRPLSGPSFYRDDSFSLYYMFSAATYKLIGDGVFRAMHVLSIAMGIVFFTALAILLKRTMGIHHLMSSVVFLSMPVLVTIFLYGNEAAFSLTFFIASLLFLTLPFPGHGIASAFLLTAAFFCRPDTVLLVPFWIGWLICVNEKGTPHAGILKRVLVSSLSVAFFSAVYWAVFIRRAGALPSFTFEYATNPKLLAAYLSYPFNPTVVVLGAWGLVTLLRRNWRLGLVLLLGLVPLPFFISNLSSPKYIIPMALSLGIPAVLMLQKMSPRHRIVPLIAIGVWWIVSISPYGLFGPAKGGFLYVPTADGPIPSGAYASFYDHVQDGFFSLKYKSEMEGLRLAIDLLEADESTALVGRFSGHTHKLDLVRAGRYELLANWEKRWYVNEFPGDAGMRYIMLQRTYLSLNKMSDAMRPQFTEYLRRGQVRNLSGTDDDVFPLLIEVGDTVPMENDVALGARILFAMDHYNGNGIVRSHLAPVLFLPTYWVKRGESAGDVGTIYSDDQWLCYNTETPMSQVWLSELPTSYYAERDPNL